jgi:hypothetical protein
MDHHDELDQQLWEFVYDLLPEQDAASLRQRITSEPDVARAYVRVKLRSELVADAARVTTPPLALQRPSDRVPEPLRGTALRGPHARRWPMRVANALTALAATLLIGLIGYGFLQPERQEDKAASVATEWVRAEVSVPRSIYPEATNFISVSTATPQGTPVPTRVAYRFFDARGGVALHQDVTTNSAGYAHIRLPRSLARSVTGLEITAGDELWGTIRHDLPQAVPAHLTFLTLDKREYLPGEAVQFRSVVLSQLELVSSHEVTAEFSVLGPDQQPLPDSTQQVRTERGVGNGSFQLPAQATSGAYTVAVRSPDAEFAEVRQAFVVQPQRNLRVDLQFARNQNAAGEEVVGQLQVFRANGDPAAGAKLKADATVEGQPLADLTMPAAADERGYGEFRLQVPVSLGRRPGVLNLQVQDRDQEARVTQEIPAGDPHPVVTFFPEGGQLVAGYSNRVYFQSRDAQGNPIDMSGRVLNEQGEEAATVQSLDAGRGVFDFIPEAGQKYSLEIQNPARVPARPELPFVLEQVAANLTVEQAVLPPQAPVAARLHATVAPSGLLVAAYCRGVLVGQEHIDDSRFTRDEAGYSCDLQLPLAEEAAGTIRLTALDYDRNPPVPLSERLVFRPPGQQLRVRVEPLPDSDPPTPEQRLQISTLDESDQPLQAVVGLTVTGTASPRAGNPELSLAAFYYLAAELVQPSEIGDGLRYLGDNPDARTALDLLLGAQPVLQLPAISPELIVSAEAESLGQRMDDLAVRPEPVLERLRGDYYFGMPVGKDLPSRENRALETPVLLSNQIDLAASVARTPALPSITVDRRILGQWLMWGGLLLAVASVVTVLLRWSQRASLVVPVLVTATVSLLIGVMWVGWGTSTAVRVAQAPSSAAFDESAEGELLRRREERFAGETATTDSPHRRMLAMPQEIEDPRPLAAETLPAVDQLREEQRDLNIADQQRDASPAMAGVPALTRGAAVTPAETRDGTASEDSGALGGGFAMKGVPPAPGAPESRAAAAPAPVATAEPLAESVAKIGDVAAQRVAPERALPSRAAQSLAPDLSPIPKPAAAHPMMAPSSAAAPFAGKGSLGEPVAGKSWFQAYGSGQAAARGKQVPETLFWAPTWQPDENGRGVVLVPRRGFYRIYVRADGHAAGRLGSADLVIENPAR